MSPYLMMAKDALYRVLVDRPDEKSDLAFQGEFIAGFVAACEAVETADLYSDPSTYTKPTDEASEGYRLGYERAIYALGIEL